MIASDTDSFKSSINDDYHSDGNMSFEDNDNHQEEEILKDQLEEIEFGKILKANKKIEEQKFKMERHFKKPTNLKEMVKLKKKFESLNKKKEKSRPKESSALIRPRKNSIEDIKVNQKFKRDPRFDSLSSKRLSDRKQEESYGFVKSMANDYLQELDKIKTVKKLTDEEYELLKNQKNVVKGWIDKEKRTKIKQSVIEKVNQNNQERKKAGKSKLFLKSKQIEEVVRREKDETRDQSQERKYLKRKKHRENKKKRNISIK